MAIINVTFHKGEGFRATVKPSVRHCAVKVWNGESAVFPTKDMAEKAAMNLAKRNGW